MMPVDAAGLPVPRPINYINPIPGQAVTYPALIQPAIRLTTLLDEFTYDTSGEPAAGSGQLERGGRYTVAWLIQRSRNDVPAEVNVNVLVYAGRSPTDTPSPESAFVADSAAGSKQIIVRLNGQAPPALRKGSWIAWTMPVTPVNGVTYPVLDFYRVVGVSDEVPDQLSVEIEAPIKSYVGATYTNRAVVVFENLVEVFERGSVSPSSVANR
jgi:hypothetical protein